MSETYSAKPRGEKLLCAALFIIAIAIASWIRFHELQIKPFHHDEGVNSYFLLNLARSGNYQYDPTNYHGPSLYYLALIAMTALGQTDFALRFTPALFGVLAALLVWPLRRHLGTIGTAAAAFGIALSPGLVYYSRDFIHEMLFGFAVFGVVVGAWRYAESRNFFWFALAAVSMGLLLTTKETAVVNLAVIVIALPSAAVWSATRKLLREHRFTPGNLVRDLKHDAASLLPSFDHALAAAIIAIFLHIFLYSSLFKHWPGVTDFFKSIWLWTKERSTTDHVHPFTYYLGILLKLELPLLIGSFLGGLVVLLKGTRFWLFTAAWTLGTVLAYSIIPYKTPWLMVSFLIPMALMTGYGAEQIYQLLPTISGRLVWSLALITSLLISGRIAWTLNFEKHDDNSNSTGYFADLGQRFKLRPYVDGQYGYVYAQTDRDFLFLVEAIKNQTERFPSRNHTGVLVAASEYWPLPWYLRDYDQVAFTGNLPPGDPPLASQPIIVAKESQRPVLDAMPGWRAATQPFVLRPGVSLLLYVKEENP